mgnify:CR=1 FL=1
MGMVSHGEFCKLLTVVHGRWMMASEECGKRTVKHAYHRLCKACSCKRNCCARCKSDKAEIVTEAMTEAEINALEQRAQEILNTLPVRRRKTITRLFEAGEITLSDIVQVAEKNPGIDSDNSGADDESDDGSESDADQPEGKDLVGRE